jgi:general stress protein 26
MKADERKAVAAALALSRRAGYVYVSSVRTDGHPNTRVMFNLLNMRARAVKRGPAALPGGFASWLGTNTSSGKVVEVRRDPRVCLYYSDLVTFEGLTLWGRVEEVHDLPVKRALWKKGWEMYYRGGIEGGDYTILRFVPERGRYYHGLRLVDFDASRPVRRVGAKRGLA